MVALVGGGRWEVGGGLRWEVGACRFEVEVSSK